MRIFSLLFFACIALSNPVEAAPKKVAIASFGEHWALQQIIDGMKAGMSERGYRDGIDLVYTFTHVNWDRNLVAQMLTKVAADKPDVLFTLTTPVAQTAVRVVRDPSVPVVFAAIQDPVIAGLVPAWDKSSSGMTGATNPADAEGTLRFIKMLLPHVRRLGLPYNPGDDADTALRERFVAAAPQHGIELLLVGVDNINNMVERLQSLAGRVDAIYIIPSSLLQSATPLIASATNRMAIPTFNGLPEPILKHEMLGTYSVDWLRIGRNAAVIIDQVLRGRPVADIPPINPTPQDHAIFISAVQLQKFKLELPEALRDCDCVVPDLN